MHFAAHFPSFHGRNRVHGPFFRVEAPVPVIVFLVVSLLVILGTLAAYGQSPAHNPSQPAVLETVPLSDHCPLSSSAKQGMSGELRNAKSFAATWRNSPSAGAANSSHPCQYPNSPASPPPASRCAATPLTPALCLPPRPGQMQRSRLTWFWSSDQIRMSPPTCVWRVFPPSLPLSWNR